MEITHFSLFSGIGGLDLAAEWAGFTTIGQCEYAEYPYKVLCKHWPDVPKWRDIHTLTGDDFYARTGLRTVDVISGGFPCQPFSVAGKRRGKKDDRYLWPEMLRVVREIRPAWVIGENVAGIINMELDNTLADLETAGYQTRTFILPACGVGAPHQRNRVFIIANTNSARLQQSNRQIQPGRNAINSGGKYVADTNLNGLEKSGMQGLQEEPGIPVANGDRRAAESRLGGVADGLPDWVDRYWNIEPDITRTTTRRNHRVNRLKCLGNAVVPQQAYPIFKAIADILKYGGENRRKEKQFGRTGNKIKRPQTSKPE